MKYSSNSQSTKKTLDIQHNMKLVHFQEKEQRISKLKKEFQCISNSIEKLNMSHYKNNGFEVPEHVLEQYLSYSDERKNIEKELLSIENSTDEVDYYVNTSPLLFQYYDLLEKGINESMTNNVTEVKEKSILKYFVSTEESEEKKQNNNIASDDKATLLDKYLSYTDSNYIKNTVSEHKDECHSCGSSNRNLMVNDGMIFCNDCHTIEYIIVDHERPSYRDPPKFQSTLWASKSLIHQWLVI